MADNPQDLKLGSKLPRLPKIQGSAAPLPVLPTLRPPKKEDAQAVIPALQSSAVQLPSVTQLSDDIDEDAGETQAISQPSPEELEKALANMQMGGSPFAKVPSAPAFNAPSPSVPAFNAPSPSTPAFNAPSPSVPAFNAPSPSTPAFNAPPLAMSAASGNVSSDDDDLQFEDEGLDDAGEKTMMLDAAPDDDLEDDIGGEKTQISMSSMDYDPLSGKLIVEAGKTNQREYILVREKTSIGRAPDNDITISDIAMSRKHIEIDKFTEGFRIRDLDSGNGTVLNGYRIRVGQLRNGDIIEIGSIRFRFEQSGGDPSELWRGEPKVEYHPNQKGGAQPSASVPSFHAPAVSPSRPSQPSPMPIASQPKMESMLERQGGGIAAVPAWAAASPMTAPYMASFSPNALRNVNAPPLWANIVLVVLIVICLGSISWFFIEILSHSSSEKEVARQNAIVERINDGFTVSLNSYQNRDFEQALKSLQDALDLDKDGNLIADRSLFDYYQKLYRQEGDLSNQISQIRDKTYSNGQSGLAEVEKDLEFLQKEVPADSVNKQWAERAYNRKLDQYARKLRIDIRELISSDHISEAKDLIAKLSQIPDTDTEIRNFRKLISDKEKTQN